MFLQQYFKLFNRTCDLNSAICNFCVSIFDSKLHVGAYFEDMFDTFSALQCFCAGCKETCTLGQMYNRKYRKWSTKPKVVHDH